MAVPHTAGLVTQHKFCSGWCCLVWEERVSISSYKPHFTKAFTASQQHQSQLTFLSTSSFLGPTSLKKKRWHRTAMEGPSSLFHLVQVTPKDAAVLWLIPGWTSACPAVWVGIGHRSWWQGPWCQQWAWAAAMVGAHVLRTAPRENEMSQEGCIKRIDRFCCSCHDSSVLIASRVSLLLHFSFLEQLLSCICALSTVSWYLYSSIHAIRTGWRKEGNIQMEIGCFGLHVPAAPRGEQGSTH